jgi:hypothetical protein
LKGIDLSNIEYYDKYCKCGCGSKIRKYNHHRYTGIPDYVNHHGMSGKKHKESSKIKIGKSNSIANKGKKLKDIHKKGCKCSFCLLSRGIKPKNIYSKESRRKISIANSGKNNGMYGRDPKLHYNWKGGKSFEKYSLKFTNKLKDEIRDRYKNRCQICGILGIKKLDVHHIDYNKKNCSIDNLIPLCKSCHVKTNFNREYWRKSLKEKIV